MKLFEVSLLLLIFYWDIFFQRLKFLFKFFKNKKKKQKYRSIKYFN